MKKPITVTYFAVQFELISRKVFFSHGCIATEARKYVLKTFPTDVQRCYKLLGDRTAQPVKAMTHFFNVFGNQFGYFDYFFSNDWLWDIHINCSSNRHFHSPGDDVNRLVGSDFELKPQQNSLRCSFGNQ